MIASRRAWEATLAHVWAALCLALILASGPARADYLVPPPPPAVLVNVAVKVIGPNETRFTLTFAPKAPTFSVIQKEGARTAIGFALSSRGPAARVPSGSLGILRQADFEQQDSILILRLTSAGVARLTAKSDGASTITLDLTGGTAGAGETETATRPAGGLPHEVDRPPGEDGFVVVPLKYADVSEVVGLLTDGQTVKSNDTFIPAEPAFGSAGMNGGMTAPPPPPPTPDQLDQPEAQSVDDSIAIDRRLNAVILKGSPERIADLKRKIEAIDVPVDSVLLETEFVELDESGARNVGFNFNNANGAAGQITLTSEGFSPPGIANNRGIISASLQAELFAQVQQGHGRIVSKPQIAALSGSTAKIVTGDALPILTAITLSGVNGVSQQVQYVNVGVTLQIAPRVSSDGFVTSHIFCVVSSVSGYSQGYPTISQREAETSATVRDGETYVIGGLTQASDIASRSKVPGIGDVPVLGEFFRLDNETKAKTELYIVVTPHIIRRGAQNPPR